MACVVMWPERKPPGDALCSVLCRCRLGDAPMIEDERKAVLERIIESIP